MSKRFGNYLYDSYLQATEVITKNCPKKRECCRWLSPNSDYRCEFFDRIDVNIENHLHILQRNSYTEEATIYCKLNNSMLFITGEKM